LAAFFCPKNFVIARKILLCPTHGVALAAHPPDRMPNSLHLKHDNIVPPCKCKHSKDDKFISVTDSERCLKIVQYLTQL